MQVLVAVNMSPQEYAQRYREVEWPTLEVCPVCGAHARLRGHGWYGRNALPSRETELVVMIHRLLCPVCHRTVSLVLAFLRDVGAVSWQIHLSCSRR